jgi:hypothetical protein
LREERIAEGPVPGQLFPVQEDHEIRQITLVVAVAPNLAHQVHAHAVPAQGEEQAMAERKDAGVAPDQIHRERHEA